MTERMVDGDPLIVVTEGAEPPSTGTTEYVALRTRGSKTSILRGDNGKVDVKEKRHDSAKSAELDVLRCILENDCQD